jgi:hypothetical protein
MYCTTVLMYKRTLLLYAYSHTLIKSSEYIYSLNKIIISILYKLCTTWTRRLFFCHIVLFFYLFCYIMFFLCYKFATTMPHAWKIIGYFVATIATFFFNYASWFATYIKTNGLFFCYICYFFYFFATILLMIATILLQTRKPMCNF